MFIDSCAWGYCDDLLKQIDDEHCEKKDGKTYDYDLRNYTTSHVHIMLSTALTEMIDNTECIMFYNTPNSVSLVDDLQTIKKKKKKVALSHWIYHELAMTSLVRKREPCRTVLLLENALIHKAFNERNDINIEHDVDKYLEEMIPIASEELNLWKRSCASLTHKIDSDCILSINEYEDIHPLDILYNLPVLSK